MGMIIWCVGWAQSMSHEGLSGVITWYLGLAWTVSHDEHSWDVELCHMVGIKVGPLGINVTWWA